MRKERNRFWTVFAIATVVALAAITVAMRWHRLFPSGEVSELYLRYADEEGVDATFIRGFQVNDTVSVDVTLLQATDSAGWETIIPKVRIPEEMLDEIELRKQKKQALLYPSTKGHLDFHPDTIFLNNDLLAIDWAEHTVAIFHISDIEQQIAIIGYHLDKVRNNKIQEK